MTKKIIVLLMIIIFPATASAASWFLNTWAKSAGGTINSRNMVNQTSTAGSLFKSYTTHAVLPVTVSANTGYSIRDLTVNGVSTSYPPSPATAYVQGMAQQTVYATFVANLMSITASAGYGGSVTPTSLSNIYYGQKPSSAIKFTFTPISGWNVASIGGVPAGTTVSTSLPAPPNVAVTVTFPTTYAFTSNVALSGTFAGPPVAVTGAPQTVLPGTLVTLNGSASTGAITSWTWTQTTGPGYPGTKVLADNTSGTSVSFTPTLVGTYNFRLTVTGGSVATTTVIVTNDPAAAARNQCQNCHQGIGIGTSTNVFAKWSSSTHRAQLVMCGKCHVGADSGGHPGMLTNGTVNESTFLYTRGGGNFCLSCHSASIGSDFAASPHSANSLTCSSCHTQGVHNPDVIDNVCNGCHRDASGNVANHPFAIGANPCIACHNPHSTAGSAAGATSAHFNNMTAAGYPASYVTSRSNCSNCHADSSANLAVRQQWGRSAHAA
ncbi:PKD domain-containing protein, partial [Geomonas limicola]|uniref:PKD domain-containing protein n=1 Tax=Geomonas limicola TaxID=2740186 RepID=UPI003FCE72C5